LAKRDIIKIDEELCTGCGECIPNCPEGALQLIDGKARLVSDLYCDGLGACIGECPEGAISIERRQAEPYDEAKVMDNVVKQGTGVIKAHLKHLKDHGEKELLGQAIGYLEEKGIEVPRIETEETDSAVEIQGSQKVEAPRQESSFSRLSQWPIQIHLVPPNAPFLKGADLLVAADCVAFSYGGFHEDFLKDKVLLIGCPKFDDAELYMEKFVQIFEHNDIRSVTAVYMEVPCCFGLAGIIEHALKRSKKKIPFKKVKIGIKGDILAVSG